MKKPQYMPYLALLSNLIKRSVHPRLTAPPGEYWGYWQLQDALKTPLSQPPAPLRRNA